MARPTHAGAYLCAGLVSTVITLVSAEILDAAHVPEQNAERTLARQILEATGVRGGLIAHLGCGDGRLTSALGARDRYLVQGLDEDRQAVAV